MDLNLGCLHVSSSSLKKLDIDLQTFDYKVRVLKINAPTLWYLKLHTGYKKSLQLSLSPMPSLIEADMRLYHFDLSTGKLFDWFPNAKCLKLSGLGCKLLGAAAGSVVKFDCLTKLQLGFSVDWDDLVELLETAHKLQVLFTHQVSFNWSFWREPRKVCLLHSLKTLRIIDFGCTEEELCMVKYVLRNAVALKMVGLFSGISLDLEANFDAVKRILLFPRVSAECEVAFY